MLEVHICEVVCEVGSVGLSAILELVYRCKAQSSRFSVNEDGGYRKGAGSRGPGKHEVCLQSRPPFPTANKVIKNLQLRSRDGCMVACGTARTLKEVPEGLHEDSTLHLRCARELRLGARIRTTCAPRRSFPPLPHPKPVEPTSLYMLPLASFVFPAMAPGLFWNTLRLSAMLVDHSPSS